MAYSDFSLEDVLEKFELVEKRAKLFDHVETLEMSNHSDDHCHHEPFRVHARTFVHLECLQLVRHNVFPIATPTEKPEIRKNSEVIGSNPACS